MWLLLGVAVLEWPTMAAENALGLIAAKPLLYLLAAAMGFGVNSLAYIVIQVPNLRTSGTLGHCVAALVLVSDPLCVVFSLMVWRQYESAGSPITIL